jgi:pyruvate dehydrogenase E1 component beta subunit
MTNAASSTGQEGTLLIEREMKFSQAINEAVDLCMDADPNVYIMGLGVPDPKGIFGTTLGLQKKYGQHRVMDMPTSENGMTGVAIGSALAGMRPVMVHQRLDFALLAMEQIVNQAANWHYMYGGQTKLPLVIRLIVGRGWGQGPQHSQSLHSWFAHIPGLKVVMPATAYDAKGLLIASIEENNPVIFIEHRWLHDTTGHVPEGLYKVPIGKGRIVREGKDVTLVGMSHMTIECIRSAQMLSDCGIDCEVIDVRSLRPFDSDIIVKSVAKTGRLVVADTAWKTAGFSAEIFASVFEAGIAKLNAPPKRIALPEVPSPCTPGLTKFYYPRSEHIVGAVRSMFGFATTSMVEAPSTMAFDIPDPAFTGPF